MTYAEVLRKTENYKNELLQQLKEIKNQSTFALNIAMKIDGYKLYGLLAKYFLELIDDNINDIIKDIKLDEYDKSKIMSLYMRYNEMLNGDSENPITYDELPKEALLK